MPPSALRGFPPSSLRNLCILAHVDHGKTTLADSLVASNGLISSRMAGKLRYLDSRPDEQERGITMKSSAVTLKHGDCLVNLIDSPGHVDFSSEVSTAVRLCDGAIVVVDVVEGVQPQTKVVLSQAWREGIKPILVLNKLDRLVFELKLAPLDAYLHLRSVLEQVNAVIGELFAADVMEGRQEVIEKGERQRRDSEVVYDWSSGLDDVDDSELYFSPEQGNVIFASAYEGWAFNLRRFAKIYSEKLGCNESALLKTLWGDFFIHMKAKKILRGAQARAKKPLFVQFVLENIWAVYDAARDKEKLQKIMESLQIKVSPRDLRSTDVRQRIGAVMSQWLPLAPCLMDVVCEKLPSPDQLTEERIQRLMCPKVKVFETLPEETKRLKKAFRECSSSEDAPVIVFISKMFPVPKKQLPKYKPKPLTPEEMAARRDRARQRLQASNSSKVEQEALTAEKMDQLSLDAERRREEEERLETETAFLAFARVFSGTLRPGQSLFVLGPKYDPAETLKRARDEGEKEVCDETATIRDNRSKWHITKATVGELYLLVGRELEELSAAPAGNVIGIGGLEDHVLKSATLTSDFACPPFVEVVQSAVPILRVALEPALSADLVKLEQGLRLLNQADANVQVSVTDKGEHILVTAGEVHLERCLRDLTETYARVEVNVSSPIVPFKETIVRPPKVDMVNEEVLDDTEKNEEEEKKILIQTPNKRVSMCIRAVPLPIEATNLLEQSSDLLRMATDDTTESLPTDVAADIETLKEKLGDILEKEEEFSSMLDKIWSLGPRKCGPNVLFNNVPHYKERSSIWVTHKKTIPRSSILADYDSSVVNGFQLATLAGPICEEPMTGVAFFLDEFEVCDNVMEESSSEVYGPLSGQVVSSIKDGCRRAFESRSQRLMLAMYACTVQVKAEALGKLYASLGKRHGTVVDETMVEGSSTFTVSAHLPVVESLQFAQEVRRQTSGLAMPQLVFNHWETLDLDPFWEPTTEEELTHFGEKADSENRAKAYVNDVRRRKGLAVDEKLVDFAEKQRTLTKMK